MIEAKKLSDKKIAILATDGFEEEEYTKPRQALEEAGAETHFIAPHGGTVKAWDHTEWSGSYRVDKTLDEADSEEYDNLMMPGGVMNPDKLRLNEEAVQFALSFFEQDKTVAVICHGSQTLIETGELKGKKMTSYPSVKTDLRNAGAIWVDEEVVVDQGLITSRNPDDIPAFNETMIEEFSKSVPEEPSEKAQLL